MTGTFTGGDSKRARLYDRVAEWQERAGFLEWREKLVSGLTGEVVELGAGTGRNLAFYPADVRVLASDYDPVMLEAAKARARAAQADIRLSVADAQRLPFEDGSVDNLVIGLMLCSVPKPDQALAEARRVLKPGGRLRFVEHIRDPKGSVLAHSQDAFNLLWRRISGGCNANRRTAELAKGMGFELEREEYFKVGRIPFLAPHVMVQAVPV